MTCAIRNPNILKPTVEDRLQPNIQVEFYTTCPTDLDSIEKLNHLLVDVSDKPRFIFFSELCSHAIS